MNIGELARHTGLAASRAGIALTEDNAPAIAELIRRSRIGFTPDQRVLLDGEDISWPSAPRTPA